MFNCIDHINFSPFSKYIISAALGCLPAICIPYVHEFGHVIASFIVNLKFKLVPKFHFKICRIKSKSWSWRAYVNITNAINENTSAYYKQIRFMAISGIAFEFLLYIILPIVFNLKGLHFIPFVVVQIIIALDGFGVRINPKERSKTSDLSLIIDPENYKSIENLDDELPKYRQFFEFVLLLIDLALVVFIYYLMKKYLLLIAP